MLVAGPWLAHESELAPSRRRLFHVEQDVAEVQACERRRSVAWKLSNERVESCRELRVVDVVLESSHDSDTGQHRDLFREGIDLPVLKSHLCDFEELLLHDGCFGIAVLATTGPMEVQFDEHKLLVAYAGDLKEFECRVQDAGVERNDRLELITEGEHLHSTDSRYIAAFEQLCYRLGVGEAAERVSW